MGMALQIAIERVALFHHFKDAGALHRTLPKR